MKVLHSADWQLGARFKQFGERAVELREARFTTLHRELEIARDRKVNAFVIAGDLFEDNGTTLVNTDTSIAGMKLDFTLTSATTYLLTMTPLGGPAGPYTQVGTLANGGPIDWVQFQLYNNVSGGLNDTANNFEISGMTISPAPEPSTLALVGLGSTGLLFMRRRK